MSTTVYNVALLGWLLLVVAVAAQGAEASPLADLQQALYERDEARVEALLAQHPLADAALPPANDRPLHTLATDPIREPGDSTRTDWAASARLMHLLLARGADPDAFNGNQLSPLMVLALQVPDEPERLLLAEILLAGGAAIDLQDERGNTALIYAVRSANRNLATLLIDRGADAGLENKAGESAASLAGLCGPPAVIEAPGQGDH